MKSYTNSQMEQLIDDHIHNAMHRQVLKLRLIDGLTYEKIAEDVDRTPRQIGYILSRDIPVISKYLM